MKSKIIILFMVCLFSFISAYAWTEPENNVSSTSDFSDYNTYFSEEAENFPNEPIRKTVHQLYQEPRHVSGYVYYSDRLPQKIATTEKIILVDPKVHAWGAYSAEGKLLRAGLATAGANWCADIGRPCRTRTGTFHIISLGNPDCISSIYPIDQGGGAPMPYCMYFNGSQALHGSHELKEANVSHGCVRISVKDAEWLRYHFAQVGTKVVIKSY